jgi:hypothetical protein
MKFIGLLLLVVIGNALERGVTLELIFWFLVGLGMVFFDVITHWMKVEISSKRRRRY